LSSGRPTGDRLGDLRRGLAETVVEVRRIVAGLRPPAIDELGLFGAVSALGRELADSAGLGLEIDVPREAVALPAAVEVTAYRVAQEALTNVVRHAGASCCRVTWSVSDHGLVLEVQDNGRGGAAESSGVGLRSMRERADQIGGRLEVSSVKSGTRVTLTLPLGGPA
jgi:signal transduction histidine kinase